MACRRSDHLGIAATYNHTRYVAGQSAGHYESFFQRANHPTRPLAFWIRYTVFAPKGRPSEAVGELWAILFDGEQDRHVAVKQVVPMSECAFDGARFAAQVGKGGATLSAGTLVGAATTDGRTIAWDLAYRGDEKPLFDLPKALYAGSFPKAKALVGLPLARFGGSIEFAVDGHAETWPIDGWIGSQNHNWGSQHTDHYAWGQVAGFEGAPETFLELATARLRLGPRALRLWTPFMTPIVLRHAGREHRLNRLVTTLRRARFDYERWEFRARGDGVRLSGVIEARPEDFVCLRYENPPGGDKFCLNTKIARCELRVTPDDGTAVTLTSPHGAAFEILTDKTDHGMQAVV